AAGTSAARATAPAATATAPPAGASATPAMAPAATGTAPPAAEAGTAATSAPPTPTAGTSGAAPGATDATGQATAGPPVPASAGTATAPAATAPAIHGPPPPRPLAHLAADPGASRGRRHAEDDRASRGPRDAFQRDRDRIIHSVPFRRLRHKTQVFVAPDGDHFRLRLTHSLEVAQIGRTMARALGLNEDLTEALCLAHDLGHPPFGHAGEDALNEALADAGGFDHNAHTIRIVTRLETPYPDFDGLNLSWEALEA